MDADRWAACRTRHEFGGSSRCALISGEKMQVYGHKKVSVLDGGLDAWLKAGFPVDNKTVTVRAGDWTAKSIDESLIIYFGEIDFKNLSAVGLPYPDRCQINYLDARPQAEFNGSAPLGIPSPNPLMGSHIAGALNVPVENFVFDGYLVDSEFINAGEFKALISVPSSSVLCMCRFFEAAHRGL